MTHTSTEKITAKQREAIESLLSTQTTDDASKLTGISRSTIHRWLQDPTFQKALLDAENDALKQVSRNLIALATKAVNVLHEALEPTEKINVRLRASEQLLNNLLKIRELVHMEERLLALEAKINGTAFEVDEN